MGEATRIDAGLFGGAPLIRALVRCHLIRSGQPDTARRVQLAIAIAWLPLAVLTVAQVGFLTSRGAGSFFLDVAAHARFLVALPTLIAAEPYVARRLGALVQHFADVGIVTPAQRPQFDRAVASTRRLVHSWVAELAIIVLGYATIVLLLNAVPLEKSAGWQFMAREPRQLSWAGWWHVLVSLPLLLIVFLGVLWRVYLWLRLLLRISRLDLLLVPAHPDGAAGLRFVSASVRAFALYGFALGAIVAGPIANRVLYDGASPLDFHSTMDGLLVFVFILFAGPLLVFSRTLIATRRRGVLEYGALAHRLGVQFEREWLARRDVDRDAPGRADFSATTDLYSIAANALSMRFILFDLTSMLLLLILTVAPFVPVVLIAVPVEAVLTKVAQMLL